MDAEPCIKCGSSERVDGRCRPCRRKRQAAWARAHPQIRVRKGPTYSYQRQLRRYASKGIIPDRSKPEWCECCGRRKAKCLDHDHKKKKFRGWLCVECNAGIGLLGDDQSSVDKASAYIKRAE